MPAAAAAAALPELPIAAVAAAVDVMMAAELSPSQLRDDEGEKFRGGGEVTLEDGEAADWYLFRLPPLNMAFTSSQALISASLSHAGTPGEDSDESM